MASSSPSVPRDCIACDGGCGQTAPSKRCSNCQLVYYCGKDCQRKHRKIHAPDCRNVDTMRRQLLGLGEGAVLSSELPTGVNTECSICLESEMKNPIVLEGCKHAFCSSCLLRWQETKRYSPFSSEGAENHNCPLCRSETGNIVDTLLTSAKLSASRANRPGCLPEEQARFREQALNSVDQALDSETPHLHAYCIKIDILLVLKDGKAALECVDELVQVNENRWEAKRDLKRKMAQTDMALARGDEGAEDLMQAVMEQVAESGLPAEVLDDGKETHFGMELDRAEAYQILQDWEAAKTVYQGMLMSMESPDDGTPVQQRRVFMGLSRCAYELGVYDKAIQGAEAALEMNRHFPGVHRYKALAQKAQGDIDAAIATVNRAVLYETPWDEENKEEVLKLYNELLAEKSAGDETS